MGYVLLLYAQTQIQSKGISYVTLLRLQKRWLFEFESLRLCTRRRKLQAWGISYVRRVL
jgi:hypothetical protein